MSRYYRECDRRAGSPILSPRCVVRRLDHNRRPKTEIPEMSERPRVDFASPYRNAPSAPGFGTHFPPMSSNPWKQAVVWHCPATHATSSAPAIKALQSTPPSSGHPPHDSRLVRVLMHSLPPPGTLQRVWPTGQRPIERRAAGLETGAPETHDCVAGLMQLEVPHLT